MDYLSPAEQQAEMMAEKERYFSLYTNEVEEELYKGEEDGSSQWQCLITVDSNNF
jgi:hypothetical protein